MTDFLRRITKLNGTYFSSGVDIALALAIVFLCIGITRTFFQVGDVANNASSSSQTFAREALNATGGFDFEALKVSSPFNRKNIMPGEKLSKGPAAITKLDLKLRGVRLHKNGQSSAIIKVADKPERPYTVGEPIMPGVSLKGVYFDFIQITHSGVTEQLYLDGAKAKKVNQKQEGG